MPYIPILSEQACEKRISKLLEPWKRNNCRLIKQGSPQWIEYDNKLISLCDLAPPKDGLVSILKSSRLDKWKDDFQFYLNMQQYPQIGCMMIPDRALMKKQKRMNDHHTAEGKNSLGNSEAVCIYECM